MFPLVPHLTEDTPIAIIISYEIIFTVALCFYLYEFSAWLVETVKTSKKNHGKIRILDVVSSVVAMLLLIVASIGLSIITAVTIYASFGSTSATIVFIINVALYILACVLSFRRHSVQ
jgi:hypothetical protein